MNYKEIQQEEAATWLIEDEKLRREKAMRESIRYPLLKKQMGLDYLDTSEMEVWDIGAGPLGGVSSVLNCKIAYRFDPLTPDYKKYFPCIGYRDDPAEKLGDRLATPDLVIVTNALDHFEYPEKFLQDLVDYMKPSGYFAHLHAIDNAISHPHPAHVHNVNPELFRRYLEPVFETCWYTDFQHDGLVYGWKRQPAFSGLYRKVTGYGKR